MEFQVDLKILVKKYRSIDLNSVVIENYCKEFETELIKTCYKNKKKYVVKRSNAIWWNESLKINKSRVRALRRRYQSTQDKEERLSRKVYYKSQLAKYKKLIIETKKEIFRKYLDSTVVSGAFVAMYDIIKGKKSRKVEIDKILKEDGTYTDRKEEAYIEVIKYHFPLMDEVERNCENNDEVEEVDITKEEVELAIHDMKEQKAPGYDGLALSIIKMIYDCNKDWFLSIFNFCWSKGLFPNLRKIDKVILIYKTGIEATMASSYRTITYLG